MDAPNRQRIRENTLPEFGIASPVLQLISKFGTILILTGFSCYLI
jgi:hypothetical protein